MPLKRRFVMIAWGVGTMLLLHVCLLLLWKPVFVHFPARGYEKAVAEGHLEPFFTHSPVSLFATWAVLFAASLAVGLTATRIWEAGLLFGLGAFFGSLLIILSVRAVRESNLTFLLPCFFAGYTLLPSLAGAAVADLVRRFRGRRSAA